jgi:hypothetical protein
MALTAHPSSTADLDRLLRSLGTVRQQVRTERLVERLRTGPVEIDNVRHRWLRRATELDLRAGPTLAVWLYHPLSGAPVELRSIGWHDSVGWFLAVTTARETSATLLAWQLRIGPADGP